MKTALAKKLANQNLNMAKRLFLTFAATVVFVAAGCKNTAHGVGQDVEKAGEKIQEKTK